MEFTLKTGISLTVLYLFYWLVLHRDTHFGMNRLVLLFSVVISMALPFLAQYMGKELSSVNQASLTLDFGLKLKPPLPGKDIPENVYAAVAYPFKYGHVIMAIYFIGACIVFARLIYQAIFLHAVSRLSNKISYGGYTIVCMNTDIIPFSYFRRIFIPSFRVDDSSFDSIIAHEKSHLSQGHFFDLFIVEILTVLQWFNPVIWFIEKSIKEVHEYLADEEVLHTGKNQGRYQAVLVNQALGGPVFILTNQFNQSLIKKRITMMKKMKTSRVAKLKAFLILPLIAGLLLAFANPKSASPSPLVGNQLAITGNVSDGSTGDAVQGGLVLIKGTTEGTITDKNGNYSINVTEKRDILVFSKVGFKSQEIPVESNTKINVQLEKEILVVDFSQGNKLSPNAGTANAGEHSKGDNKGGGNLYVVTDELPSYPGGTEALQRFLMKNIQYPANAKNKGIEGKVYINFIVDAEGAVTNAKVMRGISPDLDAEALRIVNLMQGWKPASHNGEPLSMGVTMPVEFKVK